MDSATHEKIRSLADAVCSDTVADEELDALADLLRGNDEAQASYLNYCRLHAELQFFFRGRQAHNTVLDKIHAQTAISTSSVPPLGIFGSVYQGTIGFFSQEIPFSLLVATVVTALGLLAGSLVYVSQPQPLARTIPTPSPAPSVSDRDVVGKITEMVDVKWGAREGLGFGDHGSETANSKSGIKYRASSVSLRDKFVLTSGLMEITYDTGARVVLQGPVTYEVDSRDGGYLSLGKLTARLEKKGPEVSGQKLVASGQWSVASEPNLPSPASGRGVGGEGSRQLQNVASESNPKSPNPQIPESPDSNPQSLIPNPFAIHTPTATVTDLGTEFGVEVTKLGVTSAHVFRGLVELQPVAHGDKSCPAIRLAADEAACVELADAGQKAVVRRGKADAGLFVRAGQLPQLSDQSRQKSAFKSFERWRAYSQELRRDPSLVAYYDFQRPPKDLSQLMNVAENGHDLHHGEIVKAAWCEGRMPGKDGLLFDHPTHHVRVDLPQKTDDITLAIWLCVDSLKEDYASALLMSESWGKVGQLHWQLDCSEKRLVFSTASVSNTEEFTITNGAAKSWEVVTGSRPLHGWLQLVSVFDHRAKHVRFYVNGRALNTVDYATFAPLAIGKARIGVWDRGQRPFHGKIDELVIFGRPLKDVDVRRMYEAGKP